VAAVLVDAQQHRDEHAEQHRDVLEAMSAPKLSTPAASGANRDERRG
jgi:hypothetical protein